MPLMLNYQQEGLSVMWRSPLSQSSSQSSAAAERQCLTIKEERRITLTYSVVDCAAPSLAAAARSL
jgi:hypothetical protein